MYAYRGERLSVKQAAERVHVSEGTMRYRLQKCGDDMEAAMSYYTNECPPAPDTDAMVAALVNSIMGDGTNPDDELPEGAISGGDEPIDLADPQAEEQNETEATPQIQQAPPLPNPQQLLLCQYNRAIAAMMDLAGSDMLDASVAEIVCVCMGRLRQARSGEFDCYVDWDAVVGSIAHACAEN